MVIVPTELKTKFDEVNRLAAKVDRVRSIDALKKIERSVFSELERLSTELSIASTSVNNLLLDEELARLSSEYLKARRSNDTEHLKKVIRSMYFVEHMYNRPVVRKETAYTVLRNHIQSVIERKRFQLSAGRVVRALEHGGPVEILLDRRDLKVVFEGKKFVYRTVDVWRYFDDVFNLEENGITGTSSVPIKIIVEQQGDIYRVSVHKKRVENNIVQVDISEYTVPVYSTPIM